MNSNSKRTQRDYSLAFKLSVVDEVEKGECTYKQAQVVPSLSVSKVSHYLNISRQAYYQDCSRALSRSQYESYCDQFCSI
jgi:transposase-like protein